MFGVSVFLHWELGGALVCRGGRLLGRQHSWLAKVTLNMTGEPNEAGFALTSISVEHESSV